MYAVGFSIDLHNCSNLWDRTTNLAVYFVFAVGYLVIYSLLVHTAKQSAYFVYKTHDSFFMVTLIVILAALLVRFFIESTALHWPKNVIILQWTNFIYCTVILIPIIFYTYKMKRDEDCLICFNRHQQVNFSRYQHVRKKNDMKEKTAMNAILTKKHSRQLQLSDESKAETEQSK